MSLVERQGDVRSFPMARVTADLLHTVIKGNVHPQALLMTDDFPSYRGLAKDLGGHETVKHSEKEYVRGDVHTNTVEGYFSILKRGIYGTYHHVGSRHLFRYLDEFDFRYNGRKVKDAERSVLAVQGAEGKRLTYKPLTWRGRTGLVS